MPASRRHPADMTSEALTTSGAARLLGVSAERVRQLADTGVLPCKRTALGRLFDPEAVAAVAASRVRYLPHRTATRSDA